MTVELDRAKQKFFIFRRGNPWPIGTMDGRVTKFTVSPSWLVGDAATRIAMAPSEEALEHLLEELKRDAPERVCVACNKVFGDDVRYGHLLCSGCQREADTALRNAF